MKRFFLPAVICALLASCAYGGLYGGGSTAAFTEITTEESETTEMIAEIGKSGLKKNAVVVFTGDSITDGYRQDRTNPCDLGSNNYVTMFNDYIQKNFPEDGITVYNTGHSGYWIQHLTGELKPFVYDLDPDYLIVNIGTNNAWFDKSPIENVEAEYRKLVDLLIKNTHAEIILVQPYLYESDFVLDGVPLNTYIPRMNEISDITCRVAAEKGLKMIFYSDIFRQALQTMDVVYKPLLSVDGIHPNTMGYRMFFDVLCRELGISGYSPRYDFDFTEIKAKYGIK